MSTIPETVILDMQASVHRHRDKVTAARAGWEAQTSLAEQAKRNLDLAEHELREVVAFLDEHNSDATDWYAEFGLDRLSTEKPE